MQRSRSICLVLSIALTALLSMAGCSQDDPFRPEATIAGQGGYDPASIADEMIAAVGWTEESIESMPSTESKAQMKRAGKHLRKVERQVIHEDIVHYRIEVNVGPGPYDFIGIHRVVKERRPFKPMRTPKALFMIPGDGVTFENIFLTSLSSASIPDAQALPVYLAEDGVDVWGIDLGWSLLPEEISDFSFMESWGLARDLQDLQLGLAVARLARGMTGGGFGKLHLLGYSRGGLHGYAYLNEETQRPDWDRHVSGFIPVDILYKTDLDEQRDRVCGIAAQHRAMFDSGMYQDPSGTVTKTVGTLATIAPDDPSPVLPGLSNMQAALVLGSATFNILDLAPLFHWMGGMFDPNGIPTGLQFTQVDFMLDFFRGFSPYEPVRMMYEGEAIICGEEDLPFDDHLGEITVPVLNIGAQGGFGEFSSYTLSLLGSTDVTSILVQFYPPELKLLDYGHVDLFTADDAADRVWQPISAWIDEHSGGHGRLSRRPGGH